MTAPDGETPADDLMVRFVVPHYFLSLLDVDGIAGTVYFKDEDGPSEVSGVITGMQNAAGAWLINIEEVTKPGFVLCRTHIENVKAIVIS